MCLSLVARGGGGWLCLTMSKLLMTSSNIRAKMPKAGPSFINPTQCTRKTSHTGGPSDDILLLILIPMLKRGAAEARLIRLLIRACCLSVIFYSQQPNSLLYNRLISDLDWYCKSAVRPCHAIIVRPPPRISRTHTTRRYYA